MRKTTGLVVAGFAGLLMLIGAAPFQSDLSSPRNGALSFIRAMEADDMQAFASVTIGSADDDKLFEPLLNMVGAARQLEKAARDKFGREGRLIVRDSPAVGLEVNVQESDVSITGDTAILRHKGQEDADPLTLRKTAAGWKVDLTAIAHREQLSAAAGGMVKMRDALLSSARDIRAGRFKTAEEAEAALLKRIHDAVAPQAKPEGK